MTSELDVTVAVDTGSRCQNPWGGALTPAIRPIEA